MQKSKKPIIIIGAVVLLVAIVGVVFIFVVGNSRGDDDDSSESNSENNSNIAVDDSTIVDLSTCAGLEKFAVDILGRDIDVATYVLKNYFKTDFMLSTTFADEGMYSFDPQDEADVNVMNEPWGLISCYYNDNTTQIGKFGFTKSYVSSEKARIAYQELYDIFRNEYGEPSDVQEDECSLWSNALAGKDVTLSCREGFDNSGWYVYLNVG